MTDPIKPSGSPSHGAQRVREYANAKVNFYLDVRARRADGFHDLCTVMQSVSLADELSVLQTPAEETAVTFSSNACFLPTDSRNLAVRAAYAYLECAKITAAVRIDLLKRIPVAAGLAGGSSDAAAVLRALNRLNGGALSAEALSALAATIGSDVPFCLFGGMRLCHGRGEMMRELICPQPLYFVIAADRREHVSTPAAFAALDEMYHGFDGTVRTRNDTDDALIAVFTAGNAKRRSDALYNIFESAILPGCPRAADFRAALSNGGADAALMSGSGPAVFGIFGSQSRAESCAGFMREKFGGATIETAVSVRALRQV